MKRKPLSEETKRKISIANKGKNKGTHPTEETRIKLSKIHKGFPLSEEHKRKIGLANKGRHLSEEARIKMSIAHKGLFLSEEHRKKISAANKGKTHKNKGIKKDKSSWNKGIHHTEEHKKKISEGLKKGYLIKPKKKGQIAWNKGKTGLQIPWNKDKTGLQVAWNKDKTGIYNEETLNKLRQARLKQVIPSKDTKIEVAIQNELEKRGIQFLKHTAINGQPDIFINPNICVFCDGDYWHANPKKYSADSKIAERRAAINIWNKDKEITKNLENKGYIVLRFWETDIKKDIKKCVDKIENSMFIQ